MIIFMHFPSLQNGERYKVKGERERGERERKGGREGERERERNELAAGAVELLIKHTN